MRAQAAKAAAVPLAAILIATVAGCIDPPLKQQDNLMLNRGVQMLAAGSPKSAIPILSQVIASEPDGPEPLALLALAYALDLQPEMALRQAQNVKRDPQAGGSPGWEYIAMGVAALTQHRYGEGVDYFRTVADSAEPSSPQGVAAVQWLVLGLLLKGDYHLASNTLDRWIRMDPNNLTAMIWQVLIHSRYGKGEWAARQLREIGTTILGEHRYGPSTPQKVDFENGDSQTVCDAGIAAMSEGNLPAAAKAFEALQARGANTCDAEVWLALIAAATDNWPQAKERIKASCEDGSKASRSIGYQIACVVCALENRPQDMIQNMLTGQRLQGRELQATQAPPVAQPDNVWMSDKMK